MFCASSGRRMLLQRGNKLITYFANGPELDWSSELELNPHTWQHPPSQGVGGLELPGMMSEGGSRLLARARTQITIVWRLSCTSTLVRPRASSAAALILEAALLSFGSAQPDSNRQRDRRQRIATGIWPPEATRAAPRIRRCPASLCMAVAVAL